MVHTILAFINLINLVKETLNLSISGCQTIFYFAVMIAAEAVVDCTPGFHGNDDACIEVSSLWQRGVIGDEC